MPHRDRVLPALAIWSLAALAAAQEPDPLPLLTREVYATGLAEATGGAPNAQNALGVVPQQVVPIQAESADGGHGFETGVRSVPIVAVEPGCEVLGALG